MTLNIINGVHVFPGRNDFYFVLPNNVEFEDSMHTTQPCSSSKRPRVREPESITYHDWTPIFEGCVISSGFKDRHQKCIS